MDELLFGRAPVPDDVARWRSQGFVFADAPRWGLRQAHGGPCGVLAPVQAFLLVELLFGPAARAGGLEAASDADCREGLVRALAGMLERALPAAARAGSYRLTLELGGAGEEVVAEGRAGVEGAIRQALEAGKLAADGAVLGFTRSLVRARGVEQVRADMDDPVGTSLVARFGHCSQELVNLCVCGRAATNVFDGDKNLADGGGGGGGVDFILHGVPEAGAVGFLSALEAMGYGEVGSHLKHPGFPVWVCGSASHYTVLFSPDRRVGAESEEDRQRALLLAAFRQVDPLENHMVPTEQLPVLLSLVGLDGRVGLDEARRLLDPEGVGVVLRHDFVELARLDAKKGSGGSGWSCGVCTFINVAHAAVCDMCGGACPPAAPPQPAAPAPAADGPGPRNFDLLHFNGLGAVVTVAHVQLLEDVVPRESRESLREIIQTRFPTGLVEFDGPEPRVS